MSQEQTQTQDTAFAPGIRLFDKHPNAPDFVLASMVITPRELLDFLTKNPNVLTEYNGQKQLKLQIKRSQKGAIYAAIDSFQPKTATPVPQVSWGSTPAPAQQPAQQAVPIDDLPF